MVEISTYLAKSLLVFSDAIFISPLLIIGFGTRGGFLLRPPSLEGAKVWGNACLLVLFGMIFNIFLKSIFLVPLNPGLGIKGYAFPSGHMQVAFVLYGWLFLSFSSKALRLIIGFVLIGISYGLIQQGYHNIVDVLGAWGFGAITLCVFKKAQSVSVITKNPVHAGYFLILFAAIMLGATVINVELSSHGIRTFLALITFTLTWSILNSTIWNQR